MRTGRITGGHTTVCSWYQGKGRSEWVRPGGGRWPRRCAHGKPKLGALVASMRKLVVWAWALYRTGQPFDPAKLAHPSASSA
jgi:hypothetical protein